MSSPNKHNSTRQRLLALVADDLLETTPFLSQKETFEVQSARLIVLSDSLTRETGSSLRQQTLSRMDAQRELGAITEIEDSTSSMESALIARAREEAEISLGTYESRRKPTSDVSFVLEERIREHWQSYEDIRSLTSYQLLKERVEWIQDGEPSGFDDKARVALPYLHTLGRMLKASTFKQTESPPRRLEGILNSSSRLTECLGSNQDTEYSRCFRKRPRKKNSKKVKKAYRTRFNTTDWVVNSLNDIEREWQLKDQQKKSEQISEVSTKVGLSDYQASVESISPDRKLSGLTNVLPQ